jgi:hypothetical protein
MNDHFSIHNYFLIVSALVLQYPVGRKLMAGGFFASSLAGVCFAGICAGILANFGAGLIPKFFFILILINIGVLILDVVKMGRERKFTRTGALRESAVYFGLLILAACVFLANNPVDVFLEFDEKTKLTYLNFNAHYSYYASIPAEMMNADYFSRLKVMNAYPYEWTQFHFFNSGTQASLQLFLDKPNLFNYFTIQVVILVFMIVSFAEVIAKEGKNTVLLFAIFIGWLAIGFTLFGALISWNMTTTGVFSVFGIVMFLIFAYLNKRKNALVALAILAVSAIRLFPVVFAGLGIFLLIVFFREFFKLENRNVPYIFGLVKLYARRLNIFQYLFIFLCGIYVIVTIKTGVPSAQTKAEFVLFSSPFSGNGWQMEMFVYRVWGFIHDFFFQMKEEFPYYSTSLFFSKINSNIFFKYVFFGLILFLASVSARKMQNIYMNAQKIKRPEVPFLILLVFIFIYPFVMLSYDVSEIHLIKFNMMFIPYLLLIIGLCFIIFVNDNNDATLLVFILLIVTFVSQHAALIESIKVPISYIFFDLMLWGVLLLYFLSHRDKIRLFFRVSFLTLVLVMLLPNSFYSMLKLPRDYHTVRYDISSLLADDFEREKFVDESNVMTYDAGDEVANDIYSSVLGARMKYNENYGKTDKILNYRFISR